MPQRKRLVWILSQMLKQQFASQLKQEQGNDFQA
jgi:hypothetical protein